MTVIAPAQDELVKRYVHLIVRGSFDDPWTRGLKKLLKSEALEPHAIEDLIHLCVEQDLGSFDAYLSALQKHFICLLLIKREEKGAPPSHNSILKKHFEHLSIKRPLQFENLTHSYLALIAHMHGLDIPDESQAESLLLSNTVEKEKIPHLVYTAQTGVIYGLLGLLTGDGKWTALLIESASFCKSLFDQWGMPFQMLWSSYADFSSVQWITWTYVLFKVALHIDKEFESFAYRSLEHLFPDSKELPVLPLMILEAFGYYLHGIGGDADYEEKRSEELYKKMGFFIAHNKEFSLASVFSGDKTSMGAIHKKHNRILAHGPHFSPLGEAESFGIQRACISLFDDLYFSFRENGFKMRGFTRINQPDRLEFQGSWMEQRLEYGQSSLQMTTRFFEVGEKPALFYVFFIYASSALIGGQPYYPRTLSHFDAPARSIAFITEGERLSIEPAFEGKMQLIPLAGGSHFWGSQFLLAYQISEAEKPYCWSFF